MAARWPTDPYSVWAKKEAVKEAELADFLFWIDPPSIDLGMVRRAIKGAFECVQPGEPEVFTGGPFAEGFVTLYAPPAEAKSFVPGVEVKSVNEGEGK